MLEYVIVISCYSHTLHHFKWHDIELMLKVVFLLFVPIMQVPSARVLQETCNHIRSLHREMDDLSERLSELLATSDMSSAQEAVIRSLLM
jgi:hypothetical protein